LNQIIYRDSGKAMLII